MSDSALVVALAVLNMGVGLALQGWLASRLGTGRTADVFQTGVALPTLFATVVLSVIPSTLIPLLVGASADRQRLAFRDSAPIWLLAVACTAAVAIAASPLARTIGGGLEAIDRQELRDFIRISSVCLPLAVGSALVQAHLHAAHRFGFVGAAGLINGVGLGICALQLSGDDLTATELAVAVVAGYALQLAWMVVGLASSGPPVHHVRLHRETRLLGPIAALAGAYLLLRMQPLLERALSSGLGGGTVAQLGYASKVQQAVILVSTFGVGVVALPAFASLLQSANRRPVHNLLTKALDLTTCFTIVACVGAFAVAPPAVTAMFVRGEFQPGSVGPVTAFLRISLASAAFMTMSNPLISLLYAAGRRRQVAVSGTVGFISGAIASVVLREPWGAEGVITGSALGAAVSFVVHLRNVRIFIPDWPASELKVSYAGRVPHVAGFLVVAFTVAIWNGVQFSPAAANAGSTALHLLLSAAVLGGAAIPLVWRTIDASRTGAFGAEIAVAP